MKKNSTLSNTNNGDEPKVGSQADDVERDPIPRESWSPISKILDIESRFIALSRDLPKHQTETLNLKPLVTCDHPLAYLDLASEVKVTESVKQEAVAKEHMFVLKNQQLAAKEQIQAMKEQRQVVQEQRQMIKLQTKAAIDQSKAMQELMQMAMEGRQIITLKQNAVQSNSTDEVL